MIVFAGGMPRPSYADRHTISVTQGAKQVVFDFTSRVVDFVILNSTDDMDDVSLSGKFGLLWSDPILPTVANIMYIKFLNIEDLYKRAGISTYIIKFVIFLAPRFNSDPCLEVLSNLPAFCKIFKLKKSHH